MIVYSVHTSEPFFRDRILEMGRSIPASSADATTDLGSSRPRVLVLSLRVCLRTGALIRSAFTSPSASHLSPRTCCVFHLFLVSAGCSEGGDRRVCRSLLLFPLSFQRRIVLADLRVQKVRARPLHGGGFTVAAE